MNVLWFSWKDIKHPQAGGAELVSYRLMTNLVKDGHSVRLITAKYEGASPEDTIGDINIYRAGGRFSVYLKAWMLFRKSFKKWPDLVIDEMNTLPFGAAFYTKKRTILLTYQLARQVWFYQMVFPLSVLGYVFELIYLRIMSHKYKKVITESESTRADLAKYGFDPINTHVIRIGMSLEPLKQLSPKKNMNMVLSLGALRPMKRTLDIVKGFEHARDQNPNLTLTIAGDDGGPYATKVMRQVENSRHRNAIQILGRVSEEKRLALMREASIIAVTSIKEGWGLIVTEANSQGTPAIVYDVDGLRDSVKRNQTGVVVPAGGTEQLGLAINNLSADTERYEQLRRNGWQLSKEFTFENSYKDFLSAIGSASNKH